MSETALDVKNAYPFPALAILEPVPPAYSECCMATDRPGADAPAITRFLRAELEQRKHDDPVVWRNEIVELARRTGLRYTVIARWLEDDPAKRTVPSPENCHKLAAALHIPVDRVLLAAGHLRPPVNDPTRPPFYEEAGALARRYKRYLTDIEPASWSTLKPVIEADLDRLRTLLDRLQEALRRHNS